MLEQTHTINDSEIERWKSAKARKGGREQEGGAKPDKEVRKQVYSRPPHSAPKNGPKQTIRWTQGFFTFEGKRAATGLSGHRGDEAGCQKLGKICSRLVPSLFWESEIDQIWPKKS